MGLVAFLGPFLLGTGPLAVLFLLFIARKAFVVLLSLASAFYWLTVLLFVAALFRAATPFPNEAGVHAGVVIASVLLEQAANYALFRVYTVLRRLLAEAGRKLGHGFTSIDTLWLSFGIGFGHAATHATFFFVSLLESTSTGATHYDFDTCPQWSYNVTAALLTLGFSLFHIFSTVVYFEGLTSRDAIKSTFPPLAHLTASLLTLSNFRHNGCLYSVPLVLSIAMGSVVWASWLVWGEIKRQFPVQWRVLESSL